MKKTFLAMLLVGGTMSLFAQNTQTGTTTQGGNTTNTSTQQSTTEQSTGTNQQATGTTQQSTGTNQQATGTTQQSTGTTGDPTTTTGNNVSNMSNSGTTGTSTDASMNNATGTNTTGANANWNGVSASTSWTPETAPSYNWNSYGNWRNMGSVYATGNTNMNNGSMNSDVSANGNMNSTGSYSAYSGTAVANLPTNVQMRFSQDFPTTANNQFSWNQYGDWFHSHYVSGGRLWQYFYSQRGDGYALVLPVLQSYVPENIVNGALQKYGARLYSISMVKTNSGNDAYQLGLIQGGQLAMQYLDENGATVNDVLRVEDSASMNATQANAAMGNGGTSGNWSSDAGNQSQSATGSDMNSQSATGSNMSNQSGSNMSNQSSGQGKSKAKHGETKDRNKAATNDNQNNNQNQQQ